MTSRFRRRLLAVGIASLMSTDGIATPAHALDRDTKAIVIASTYGIVGGTLLGLAAYPFSETSRTIWMGSSVGLYMGIIVGIYYIWDRDFEGNPLRPQHGPGWRSPEESHRFEKREAPLVAYTLRFST